MQSDDCPLRQLGVAHVSFMKHLRHYELSEQRLEGVDATCQTRRQMLPGVSSFPFSAY